MTSDTLTLRRPDDWHLHLRDEHEMRAVIGFSAQRFARAIVMPNLKPPVTTVAHARAYRERILAALPAQHAFEPLMTLYLTEDTAPGDIDEARASGIRHGREALPCRRHHALGRRRALDGARSQACSSAWSDAACRY